MGAADSLPGAHDIIDNSRVLKTFYNFKDSMAVPPRSSKWSNTNSWIPKVDVEFFFLYVCMYKLFLPFP